VLLFPSKVCVPTSAKSWGEEGTPIVPVIVNPKLPLKVALEQLSPCCSRATLLSAGKAIAAASIPRQNQVFMFFVLPFFGLIRGRN
jgi:hypothetical protein